jgi:hypothetical protein
MRPFWWLRLCMLLGRSAFFARPCLARVAARADVVQPARGSPVGAPAPLHPSPSTTLGARSCRCSDCSLASRTSAAAGDGTVAAGTVAAGAAAVDAAAVDAAAVDAAAVDAAAVDAAAAATAPRCYRTPRGVLRHVRRHRRPRGYCWLALRCRLRHCRLLGGYHRARVCGRLIVHPMRSRWGEALPTRLRSRTYLVVPSSAGSEQTLKALIGR